VQRITTLIFDLSEVLIAGLVGVEASLAPHLGVSEQQCLDLLGGQNLQDLCCGKITEQQFLEAAMHRCEPSIPIDRVKPLIRENFHRQVEGMDSLLEHLAPRHELVLLSDHAREWVEYILTAHPFLRRFDSRIFSFELGQTKAQTQTFHRVLQMVGRSGPQCLFIDDNPGNVKRATEAGITCILFESAPQLRRALASHGIDGI
jgi:HAD superfamily hydrolase (TIGR01509 family)